MFVVSNATFIIKQRSLYSKKQTFLLVRLSKIATYYIDIQCTFAANKKIT